LRSQELAGARIRNPLHKAFRLSQSDGTTQRLELELAGLNLEPARLGFAFAEASLSNLRRSEDDRRNDLFVFPKFP
jgi:hypothetical protein